MGRVLLLGSAVVVIFGLRLRRPKPPMPEAVLAELDGPDERDGQA